MEISEAPQMIVDAVKYQLADFQHTSWGLRYRVHRQDDKEDTERDLIESREGNVARTLTRHGKVLTADEEAAERERLYESVGGSLPVGRVGEAHDIAQAYLFLMQEEFSTGQTLVVDGGTVLV